MMQEDSNGDFEIVDKKMTSLLVSDGSSSTSSVLTNVAPPSALPSFLTSPLPPVAGPPPPGATPIPPPSANMAHPGPSVPYSMSPTGLGSKGPPPGQGPPPIPPLTPSSGPYPSSSPAPGHPPHPVLTGATPSASPQPQASFVSQPPAPSPQPQGSFLSQPPAPSPVTSQPQPPPPSGGSVDTSASVDLGSPGVESPPGRGWMGWIRGTVSNVGHRVAEKAKTSMDTMITTLDPQMKEFIHSGGDVEIIVASEKEVKVGAVREAFQLIFGKATISGMAAQAEGVAAQPVGFEAAQKSAEERINFLRSSGRIHPQQPIVAVENFIVELTPDCWFDMGLLLLDDPSEDILLQTYTQVTPIPPDFVNQARSSTHEDYPYKSTGFTTTVGQIASQHLQVHHSLWQEMLTGVSRRELVVMAARALAGLYKSRLSRLN